MVLHTDEWVLLIINGITYTVGGRLPRKKQTAGYHRDGNYLCLHHHLHRHHHTRRCDEGLQPACSQLCSCSNVMLGAMDRQRRILGSADHGSHEPRG